MNCKNLLYAILLPLLFIFLNGCTKYQNIAKNEIDGRLLLGKIEVNDVLIYKYDTPVTDSLEIRLTKTSTIKSGDFLINYFDVEGFTRGEKQWIQIGASPKNGLNIAEHCQNALSPPKFVLSDPDTAAYETIMAGPIVEGKVVSEGEPYGKTMKVVKIFKKDQDETCVEFQVENTKYLAKYTFSTKYGLVKLESFRKSRESGDNEALHRLVFVSYIEGNYSKRAKELGIH
jgi:hypothetical protein